MKLLYKPFSMVARKLGNKAGSQAFDAIWLRIDGDAKPRPGAPDQSIRRVALAAALEGVTVRVATAVSSQLAARAYHAMFGAWPEHSKDKGRPTG